MSTTKVRKNRASISKLLSFTLNLHFITSNQISTYRKLTLPHKQYLFRLLTSRNTKKTQADHIMPHVFLLCLKRNDPQTFNVAAPKSLFSSVYIIGRTCFDKRFSFYVITGRHYFSWKFIVTLGLFQASFYFFLWSQCFERSPYFMHYISPH